MNFDFTDDQDAIRDAARRFAASGWRPTTRPMTRRRPSAKIDSRDGRTRTDRPAGKVGGLGGFVTACHGKLAREDVNVG